MASIGIFVIDVGSMFHQQADACQSAVRRGAPQRRIEPLRGFQVAAGSLGVYIASGRYQQRENLIVARVYHGRAGEPGILWLVSAGYCHPRVPAVRRSAERAHSATARAPSPPRASQFGVSCQQPPNGLYVVTPYRVEELVCDMFTSGLAAR